MSKDLRKDKCHTDLSSIMYQSFSIHDLSFSALLMEKTLKDLMGDCFIGQYSGPLPKGMSPCPLNSGWSCEIGAEMTTVTFAR